MKNFLLGFVAAIVILPVGAIGYFCMGFADAQSDVAPSALESRMMGAAVHAAVARSAAKLAAPIADDDMLVKGGKVYVEGCQGCHGELGKPSGEDHSFYPRVPQFPYTGTQYTEPQIYWVVRHGIRMTAMSAYGRFYSEEQLWSIAAFLRRIRSLPPGVAERILAKSANAADGKHLFALAGSPSSSYFFRSMRRATRESCTKSQWERDGLPPSCLRRMAAPSPSPKEHT